MRVQLQFRFCLFYVIFLPMQITMMQSLWSIQILGHSSWRSPSYLRRSCHRTSNWEGGLRRQYESFQDVWYRHGKKLLLLGLLVVKLPWLWFRWNQSYLCSVTVVSTCDVENELTLNSKVRKQEQKNVQKSIDVEIVLKMYFGTILSMVDPELLCCRGNSTFWMQVA